MHRRRTFVYICVMANIVYWLRQFEIDSIFQKLCISIMAKRWDSSTRTKLLSKRMLSILIHITNFLLVFDKNPFLYFLFDLQWHCQESFISDVSVTLFDHYYNSVFVYLIVIRIILQYRVCKIRHDDNDPRRNAYTTNITLSLYLYKITNIFLYGMSCRHMMPHKITKNLEKLITKMCINAY